MGSRFFGLTSANKEDLFLRDCVDISIHSSTMSYWDVYSLPVPIRKYWIKRFNQAREGKEDNPNPLTEQERRKFIQQTHGREINKKPLSPSEFMSSQRNQK